MSGHPVAVVTGAGGFLARQLIGRLRGTGWRVLTVSRQVANPEDRDALAWDALWESRGFDPAGVSAYFHLAAFRPPNLEDASHARQCLEDNALLTLRLAEWVAKTGRARFLYCSAGNIYGPQREPAAETACPQLAGRAAFYLSSKYLGEVYLERTCRQLGLEAVSFRVSSLYGPGMPEHGMVARFCALARQGLPLPLRNGGLEVYDLVHVDDIADLLWRAAASPAVGVFNAGSGEGHTVHAVAELVNRVFANPAGFQSEPAASSAPAGFAPLCLEATRRTFGYAPRPFAAGLAGYRTWLETHA